jgi:hypothetical protein
MERLAAFHRAGDAVVAIGVGFAGEGDAELHARDAVAVAPVARGSADERQVLADTLIATVGRAFVLVVAIVRLLAGRALGGRLLGVALGFFGRATGVEPGARVIDARRAAVRLRLSVADPGGAGASHGLGQVLAGRVGAAVDRALDAVVAVSVLFAADARGHEGGFRAQRRVSRAPRVASAAIGIVDARQAAGERTTITTLAEAAA